MNNVAVSAEFLGAVNALLDKTLPLGLGYGTAVFDDRALQRALYRPGDAQPV